MRPTTPADVWAIAACLLCLLTRRYPFIGFDEHVPSLHAAEERAAYERGIEQRVREGEAELQERIAGLKNDWANILGPCFHYDPSQRPTAQELLARVKALPENRSPAENAPPIDR